MNKRFLLSVLVTFVLLMALGFFVHGFLLNEDYAQLPDLFRSHEDYLEHFQYMLLAQLLTAFAFVWVYLKGREDKPFLFQGVRYGLAIAALTVIPKFLIYYSAQPMPGVMVFKQIIFDTIAVVIVAIVVARLNK